MIALLLVLVLFYLLFASADHLLAMLQGGIPKPRRCNSGIGVARMPMARLKNNNITVYQHFYKDYGYISRLCLYVRISKSQ